jgi:hypothetical protein
MEPNNEIVEVPRNAAGGFSFGEVSNNAAGSFRFGAVAASLDETMEIVAVGVAILASAIAPCGTTFALGKLEATLTIQAVKRMLSAISDMREGAQQLYLVDDKRESDGNITEE